ncbi:transglutaminase-like cysteine peptidase [Ruegeria marisrubri]|uniref:transglutaminase-like cysteine peptidase n=1 Tax=Ruegeria marisrubri TaxID=1685379 RepID=UPI001CD665C3|nr:transglutaminase-like cysteine peptidase [Ruegeria marisrubri]MCA0906648.1 transglutaminase-like cysteine peptidase [Ruegeria marisrubri]
MKHFTNLAKRFGARLLPVSVRAFSISFLGVCILAVAPVAHASGNGFIPSVASSPPPSGAANLCAEYKWACAEKRSVSMSSQQELKVVEQVNRRVNRSTREVTDQSQYKMTERWALPTDRGGDCEDFALLKKRDLIHAGVDPSKLLIATVLDTRRVPHAVLVYRSSNGDLVLDNLTNRIKPWTATRYLFLRMQDPNRPGRWVGVYGHS